MDIVPRIRTYREALGISQAELAERVDITRQSLSRIETGAWMPNTLVALKLARELRVSVETLFEVEEPAPDLAPPGLRRMQLARIRDKVCTFDMDQELSLESTFQLADAFGGDGDSFAGPLPAIAENTVVLHGCDPAFGLLGGLMQQVAPDRRLLARFAPSLEALAEIAQGQGHLAGIHLAEATATAIVPEVATTCPFPTRSYVFAEWEQGLMVEDSNPLGIRGVADLAREDVRLINRQPGSGCRIMLDELLAQAGIDTAAVRGYERIAGSHWGGALAVKQGLADAALGTRAVAMARGLAFVPLESKRSDLIVPDDLLAHPGVETVLDLLQGARLKQELAALPGYDSARTGTCLVA